LSREEPGHAAGKKVGRSRCRPGPAPVRSPSRKAECAALRCRCARPDADLNR
jgi:hypothetical protein